MQFLIQRAFLWLCHQFSAPVPFTAVTLQLQAFWVSKTFDVCLETQVILDRFTILLLFS